MRLSRLQKYILRQCYSAKKKQLHRGVLTRFYNHGETEPRKDVIIKTITRSLERLIDRGFLVGAGVRTPHKWFIKEIRLMPKGRKMGRRLLGEQQKLPW